MKKSKIAGLIAAFALAVTGAVFTTQTQAKASTVAHTYKTTLLHNSNGDLVSNRALAEYTSWAVGKIGFINGGLFYQVATNEYIDARDVGNLSGDRADTNDFDYIGDYQPNPVKINEYFVKYVNALHKANGTEPVQTNTDLFNYAIERANQQNGTSLDHSTASREMNENLSSDSLTYLRKWGYVHSDRDVAYYVFNDWYTDDYNVVGSGQAGHYGHRANLIYSGPNVAMGINDKAASYVADYQNAANNQAFDYLYNYTGSNPNTVAISKDAVQ